MLYRKSMTVGALLTLAVTVLYSFVPQSSHAYSDSEIWVALENSDFSDPRNGRTYAVGTILDGIADVTSRRTIYRNGRQVVSDTGPVLRVNDTLGSVQRLRVSRSLGSVRLSAPAANEDGYYAEEVTVEARRNGVIAAGSTVWYYKVVNGHAARISVRQYSEEQAVLVTAPDATGRMSRGREAKTGPARTGLPVTHLSDAERLP